MTRIRAASPVDELMQRAYVTTAARPGADVWRTREDLLMIPRRPVVTHRGRRARYGVRGAGGGHRNQTAPIFPAADRHPGIGQRGAVWSPPPWRKREWRWGGRSRERARAVAQSVAQGDEPLHDVAVVAPRACSRPTMRVPGCSCLVAIWSRWSFGRSGPGPVVHAERCAQRRGHPRAAWPCSPGPAVSGVGPPAAGSDCRPVRPGRGSDRHRAAACAGAAVPGQRLRLGAPDRLVEQSPTTRSSSWCSRSRGCCRPPTWPWVARAADEGPAAELRGQPSARCGPRLNPHPAGQLELNVPSVDGRAAAGGAAQVRRDRAVLPGPGPDLSRVLHLLLPVGAVRR